MIRMQLHSYWIFIVFITAGDSLTCRSSASNIRFQGCSRQIADITGTLVNPL